MTPCFFSHTHYRQKYTAIISVSVNYSAEILVHVATISQSIHSPGGTTLPTLAVFRASGLVFSHSRKKHPCWLLNAGVRRHCKWRLIVGVHGNPNHPCWGKARASAI